MQRDLYARAEETPAVDDSILDLPEFDLAFLWSDRDRIGDPPKEVTILPAADLEKNYTEWISADADCAVDIREVA